MPQPSDLSSPSSPVSALRYPAFRMLWSAWVVASVCMWMNDVTAAWVMTSLTTSPMWVALVQTAATLPVFLLGLPSGALADMLDRKRYFLSTQLWAALVAAALSALSFLGLMSPLLLLVLTFANGLGLAMRWPAYSAIVPELVPRPELPAALALNGISTNAARLFGPLLAGALIATAGSAWVFFLNAVLSLATAVLIGRWRREMRTDPLGRESLGTAMRIGAQHVAQSYHLKGVLLRIFSFFFHSTALMALLALLARGLQEGGAGTFTLLMATMGAGAITASLFLTPLRRQYTRDALVLKGSVAMGLAMASLAVAQHLWPALIAMFVVGGAWITTANTLSVSIQMGLPDWVRARGMAIYQMAIMGASAVGAAVWGQLATWAGVQTSLGVASLTGIAVMALCNRLMPDRGTESEQPSGDILDMPQAAVEPGPGRVVVAIEYLVKPTDAAAFTYLMQHEGRSSRLRNGALAWHLLHDINQPGHFTEIIVDGSWPDHLRRFNRSNAVELGLRERKRAFHMGNTPPRVTRHLVESRPH